MQCISLVVLSVMIVNMKYGVGQRTFIVELCTKPYKSILINL